jgi:hypothetical protein
MTPDQHLVAGLGDLTGAGCADMGHPRAEDLEDRAGALDVRGLTADHDRERAVAGADVAAGDRRVEEGDAAGARLRGQLAGERGGDGAHVDDQGARRRRRDRALGPAEDRAHDGVVLQDRDQDLGLGGDRRRVLGRPRARPDQGLERLR